MNKSLPERQAPNDKIVRFEALRAALAEKFPRAVDTRHVVAEEGKISPGGLTEVSGSSGSISLVVQSALESAAGFVAWVGDGLDPADLPPDCLRRLLWVRCREASHAVQATDLLLRDGNLSLIILDLRPVDAVTLRRIPMSTWYRFQRLLEGTPIALAVCTERPVISAARTRLMVRHAWTLADLLRPRAELSAAIDLPATAVEAERRTA